MRRARRLLVVALVVAACTAEQQPAQHATAPAAGASQPAGLQPSEEFDVTTVTLVEPDGGVALPIPVYDAYRPRLRKRGLMERTDLPSGAGMVFRFPDDRENGFWMKNTVIPLSIAYFDADGVVNTVLDMEPCTTIRCPSYPPDVPYRGALEVNQGFFDEIGLQPGWRVELPFGLPPPEA